jgi:hypothetical protein
MARMQYNASVGDRIKLLAMTDDPCPIPVGATGTIDAIFPQAGDRAGHRWTQYSVKWDAPHERRTLMLCSPPDRFEVLEVSDGR